MDLSKNKKEFSADSTHREINFHLNLHTYLPVEVHLERDDVSPLLKASSSHPPPVMQQGPYQLQQRREVVPLVVEETVLAKSREPAQKVAGRWKRSWSTKKLRSHSKLRVLKSPITHIF